MAKYIIEKTGGSSIAVEASGAEAAKIDAYNYSGGLGFVDDLGDEHNMNPEAIADIIKKP